MIYTKEIISFPDSTQKDIYFTDPDDRDKKVKQRTRAYWSNKALEEMLIRSPVVIKK